MLAPETRALYSDVLRPPQGYAFDAGVATTFSLDLQGLLIFPVALAAPVEAEPDELLRSPVRLLDGIRRTMSRLTVFCHEAHVSPPSIDSPLFGLLEDSLYEVRRDGGSFHPKLWLLRFVREKDGDVVMRAVVLSRNMTFDRSWDVVVAVEGTPYPKLVVSASRSLGRLVRALPKLAGKRVPKERVKLLKGLADDAERTRFELPEHFEKIEPTFQAIGLDGEGWEPDEFGEDVLVVSPFLRATALRRVVDKASGQRILISRQSELDELSPEVRQSWQCRQMTDAAEATDADQPRSAARTPSGLHAKAYCIQSGAWATWWLGSANCTAAAFTGANVELMVKLKGHWKQVGIQKFLDSGFQGLVVDYEPPEGEPEADDEKKATKLAEEIQGRVSIADLRLACAPSGDGFDLVLQGTIELPESNQVLLKAWPVSLPASASLDLEPLARGESVTFSSLAAASLTRLVAFAVTASVGQKRVTLEFVRKLEADGFPKERHARILRAIIGNRSAFFQYLRYLLGAFDGVLAAFEHGNKTHAGKGENGKRGLPSEAAVLEELIQLIGRHPERLLRVDELVRDLRSSPECKEVVPDEFWDMWKTVRDYLRAEGHQLGDVEW